MNNNITLLFPRPETASFRKAIERSFRPGGLIDLGATFYVSPTPSFEQKEYVVHNQEYGERGKLKLIGQKTEGPLRPELDIIKPAVIDIMEDSHLFRVTIDSANREVL
jgi:hypothetical protein